MKVIKPFVGKRGPSVGQMDPPSLKRPSVGQRGPPSFYRSLSSG